MRSTHSKWNHSFSHCGPRISRMLSYPSVVILITTHGIRFRITHFGVLAANHVSPADISAQTVAWLVRVNVIAGGFFFQFCLFFLGFHIPLSGSLGSLRSRCGALLLRGCLALANTDRRATFLRFGDGAWRGTLAAPAGCRPHWTQRSWSSTRSRKLLARGPDGRRWRTCRGST